MMIAGNRGTRRNSPCIEEGRAEADSADRSQGLAAQPRVAWITRLWKAVLSGSGEVAAISPVILTRSDRWSRAKEID